MPAMVAANKGWETQCTGHLRTCCNQFALNASGSYALIYHLLVWIGAG